MANEYVIIVDHSAGNDSVGEMWKETKIFDGNSTIDEVMDWAIGNCDYSRKNITITKPHRRSNVINPEIVKPFNYNGE